MQDSGELVRIINGALVSAGVDVNTIYERLGSDISQFDPSQRFPHELHERFWSVVEEVTGDPEIGLHLCPHLEVFSGGVLDYLFLSSATFGKALHTLLKYQRLISDAIQLRLPEEDQGARVIAEWPSAHGAPQLRHTEICLVYDTCLFARSITGEDIQPRCVNLRCPPRVPREEYESVFGCPVSFKAAVTEIWIDPAVHELHSPYANPELFRMHEQEAAECLVRLQHQDVADTVNRHLLKRYENIGGGGVGNSCIIKEISESVGLSPRQMKYELSQAGTSFRELSNQARLRIARRLLKHTGDDIGEVAAKVGFSEPSAFYRAFKKGVGMTPVQYRESRGCHPKRRKEAR